MRPSNVLIVDDNAHQHELFKCFASTTDQVQLSHAITLDDALIHIEAAEPDLVLLDNRLQPYSDFRETIPKIRQSGYTGRVVVISADTFHQCFDQADSYEIHSVMDKFEFSLENFSTKLESLLD